MAEDNKPIEKTRYSDEELAEFKTIIQGMLEKARAEYDTLRQVVMPNGSTLVTIHPSTSVIGSV